METAQDSVKTLEDALRLAIAKSPACLSEGPRALRALGNASPVAMQRAMRVITLALEDPDALFSVDERLLLAAALNPSSATRDEELRVRVTADEKADLLAQAEAANLSLSALVRQKLGIEPEQ